MWGCKVKKLNVSNKLLVWILSSSSTASVFITFFLQKQNVQLHFFLWLSWTQLQTLLDFLSLQSLSPLRSLPSPRIRPPCVRAFVCVCVWIARAWSSSVDPQCTLGCELCRVRRGSALLAAALFQKPNRQKERRRMLKWLVAWLHTYTSIFPSTWVFWELGPCVIKQLWGGERRSWRLVATMCWTGEKIVVFYFWKVPKTRLQEPRACGEVHSL